MCAHRRSTHLIADQAPQLVQVHDGVVVLVLVEVEVAHTDLRIGEREREREGE